MYVYIYIYIYIHTFTYTHKQTHTHALPHIYINKKQICILYLYGLVRDCMCVIYA